MALPVYITKFPRIFPFRTEVPVAPLGTYNKANAAAGERLAFTESDIPGIMWIWARTQDDADAASAAMPVLAFGPSVA